MITQRPRLVVGGLEDGRASCGGLGSSDKGEISTGNAQQNIPRVKNEYKSA